MQYETQLQAVSGIPGSDRYCFTGSRAICSPPPEGSDLDIVVLCPNVNKRYPSRPACISREVQEWLTKNGWTFDQNCAETYGSLSARKRLDGVEVNAIIITSREEFLSWCRATGVAQALNLTEKKDRVLLFDHMQPWKWHKAPSLFVNHGRWVTPARQRGVEGSDILGPTSM